MDLIWFFFTFILIIYFIYVIRKESLFSLISFFIIFIILLYLIIPFLDIVFFDKTVSKLYPILIFVAFFSIACGILFGGKVKVFKSTVLVRFNDKTELLLIYFVLGISLLSLYIYIQSFGGIMPALINGAKLRYTNSGVQSIGSWGFLLYFVALSKIVACVSFYRILSGTTHKVKYKILLLLGISATLIFAIVNASRGAIVITMLMFIYTYFYFQSQKQGTKVARKVLISVAVILPILLIFIVYGKVLIKHTASFIDTGSFEFSFSTYKDKRSAAGERFVSEFSHPYESINYLLENDTELNYFQHFLTAPLNIIPSRLFNTQKQPRITEVNTKNISGSEEGGRPPGLIASLWFGGGVYFIFIMLFLYGFVLAVMQKNAEQIISKNILLSPYIIFIFFTIPWQSTNGDPSIILKSNVYLVFFILLFYFFIFVPKKICWRTNAN
jgi:oligosaccharide repeat unit polymerase